ncbi:unnamed protein product [Protopolystoma xenopodis]|uniref:UBA-like domain-containing protein n=1 Tax=Protopolystoma xenopodis TaxID=117903 RepID=A0A3S5BQW0_9PLAT|nr:unnamed protein product [Protopolystoma xenopodis]
MSSQTPELIIIEDDEDEEAIDPTLPPADVCLDRCREFARITATDQALAMLYLQNHNWNLEVNFFLQSEIIVHCITAN